MKTIIIQYKLCTADQVYKKLTTAGWPSAITAYLDSLPDGTGFSRLSRIKKDFRSWKIKQKDVVTRLTQEQILQDLLKIPTIAEAYEQMKAEVKRRKSYR